MVLVYRGMKPAADETGPLVENQNANALGVRFKKDKDDKRPAVDVVWYEKDGEKRVDQCVDNPKPPPAKEPQGISVASGSGCNLPAHRRPQEPPWNGKGAKQLKMWQLDTDTLDTKQLAALDAPLPDQPEHVVIAPGKAEMTLEDYCQDIAGTAAHWAEAPDPGKPCPDTTATTGAEPMEPHLQQLADQVGAGAPAADLVTALLEANSRGATATVLVSGLQEAAQRADDAGNEDGAESLRGILDRITGYCAPPDRITLR